MSAAPFIENISFPQAQQTRDRLPAVRGRYSLNEALAPMTWFRVGGPAEILFKPEDEADLQDFLTRCPADIPVTILGVASNLIIRDGGIAGVVIRLGRAFAGVSVDPDDPAILCAGAACLDMNAALFARKSGIAGLEFLSGIPGTIGAGIRMNAGCYGAEMCDILVDAVAYDRQGKKHIVTAAEMGMSYRHNNAPEDWIFVSCRLRGTRGDPQEIAAHMETIKASREASQPIRERTGGSTFANPGRDDPSLVAKGQGSAWQVVDAAGCRGLRHGDAQISEQHANFMINKGAATAADLEKLGELVRDKVFAHSGIRLRWEIRRLGRGLDVPVDDTTK